LYVERDEGSQVGAKDVARETTDLKESEIGEEFLDVDLEADQQEVTDEALEEALEGVLDLALDDR